MKNVQVGSGNPTRVKRHRQQRTMSITIRILQTGDESVLERVEKDTFDDPIEMKSTVEFLRDPHHHLVVALEDEMVVGFVSGVHYVHPDKPNPELWINEVGVASTHRGRGVGRAILDAMLQLGRTLGCSEAWVLTSRSNPPAMRLYASAGGEEPKEDQVMFTFRLQQGAS